MTRIPHYKDVILTSFECDYCGNKNTGFQLGQVQEQGVRYELYLENEDDLSRQVVRSGHATVSVPEVQLEIPGNTDKGDVCFQEVIIMAMHCESCGHRTNEVKSGTGVSDLGKRITLKITDPTDLARDVLKSETCELSIPELDFCVGGGLIGGKFTTLEGLLMNIREDLDSNPFLMGDSIEKNRKVIVDKLLDDLEMVIKGNLMVTFIMDDPAGNSYLQNVYAPDDDPEMTIEEYERTFEQNEELGLNDMKTENYTDDSTCNDISELS
nr:zinc finger protein ZPR1-like [Cherax quadricarinatus]